MCQVCQHTCNRLIYPEKQVCQHTCNRFIVPACARNAMIGLPDLTSSFRSSRIGRQPLIWIQQGLRGCSRRFRAQTKSRKYENPMLSPSRSELVAFLAAFKFTIRFELEEIKLATEFDVCEQWPAKIQRTSPARAVPLLLSHKTLAQPSSNPCCTSRCAPYL